MSDEGKTRQQLLEELHALRQQAEREHIVNQVAARIRETLDIDTVLQTAAREFRRALNLHDVTIQLGEFEDHPTENRATAEPSVSAAQPQENP